MPRHPSSSDKPATTPDSPCLPLEMFDNEDYDCRTPDDWLALGRCEGSHQKPIPAKALLPKDDGITSDDPRSPSLEYCWHLVGVLDYSKEKCQYLVEKVHQNSKETDQKGNLNSICPTNPDIKHWIPRIRLYFCAEDPRIFVERIQFALRYRKNAEALCLYRLSVLCMPSCPGSPSLSTDSLQQIKRLVLSTPGLRPKISETYMGELEMETKLGYDRTMNRMTSDKYVMNNPRKFSQITLPKKESANVPQKVFLFPVIHLQYPLISF
uniref:Uncharacterized protein n=1 Tax=Salarias fasciatus TaxID=181472 RepID=A0A672JDT6_SALFA